MAKYTITIADEDTVVLEWAKQHVWMGLDIGLDARTPETPAEYLQSYVSRVLLTQWRVAKKADETAKLQSALADADDVVKIKAYEALNALQLVPVGKQVEVLQQLIDAAIQATA